MDGILAVYKEAGWTSNDVIQKLRGLLRTRKIAHGGTLDPAVTGVLPVAVGKATRLLEYMGGGGKVYEGALLLGVATETEDAEGTVIEQKAILKSLTTDMIDQAMQAFCGEISQTPPMYSAVKVNGRRLYDYARSGEIVERPTRQITIHDFARTSPVKFDEAMQTAQFAFRVACSKGTYIRTLCVDLGRVLGYPANM